MRILTVVGARPQIIKAAALGRAIAGPFAGRLHETLLHTGQHYDANMSEVFFEELGIARPRVHLGVGPGGHGSQTARMIEGIDEAIREHRPDAVLLYGDTNSTLAGAVAAAKSNVPVAHVEAGLRSFNRTMPEETNRIVCDHCSTWLFCPTTTAVANLEREGLSLAVTGRPTPDRPHVLLTGDVMYDNSLFFAELATQRSDLLQGLGLGANEYILATVHRNNNTDRPTRLNAIMAGLLDVVDAQGLPVVLPLHPRTRKQLDLLLDPDLRRRLDRSTGIRVVPPAGFLDMIALERNARLVLTDSGGVQKEAYFFGKRCVILRAETEWVELLESGDALLADADSEQMVTAVARQLASGPVSASGAFGDGQAAERICAALLA